MTQDRKTNLKFSRSARTKYNNSKNIACVQNLPPLSKNPIFTEGTGGSVQSAAEPKKELPMAISAMIITSLAITNKHLRKTSSTRTLLGKSATGHEKDVPLAASATIITPLATTNKH